MMPGLTPRCDPQQISQARRRHIRCFFILNKAHPKVGKQLIAGADKELIATLSECNTNMLSGNMIL